MFALILEGICPGIKGNLKGQVPSKLYLFSRLRWRFYFPFSSSNSAVDAARAATRQKKKYQSNINSAQRAHFGRVFTYTSGNAGGFTCCVLFGALAESLVIRLIVNLNAFSSFFLCLFTWVAEWSLYLNLCITEKLLCLISLLPLLR